MPKKQNRKQSRSRSTPAGGWRELRMKATTTFYRRMTLMTYCLAEPIPVLVPRLPVEVVVLEESHLADYLQFRPDQSAGEIRARLARGDRCFACFYEGRIVDASWIAQGRAFVAYLRADLILEDGDVYNYDSYTLPEFRRHRLFMTRNALIAYRNRAEGCVRSVALVAVENKASRMTLLMAGLKPQGTYFCLRCGPWQKNWQVVSSIASKTASSAIKLPPLVKPNSTFLKT